MNRKRKAAIALALAALVFMTTPAFPQAEHASAPVASANFVEHGQDTIDIGSVGHGFLESFGAGDLSLLALYLAAEYKRGNWANRIPLAPFAFDQSVSDAVARKDGGTSFGSAVSPEGLQIEAFGIQLWITLLLDAVTDRPISDGDYKKAFIFGKAMLYSNLITDVTKNLVSRVRPDASDDRSFFSGHTSSSFVLSSYLFREFYDWIDETGIPQRSPLTGVAMKSASFAVCYGWASYVGYCRVYDRKHYLSDVLVGALVGTLCGNLFYNSAVGRLERSEKTVSVLMDFSSDGDSIFGIRIMM